MQSSTEHLSKLINERHSTVRQKFDRLLDALAASDIDRVQEANADLNDGLGKLGDVVAKEDWPEWLSELAHHTNNYRINHSNGPATWIAHLRSLMHNQFAMEDHTWFSKGEEEAPFDVDQLINAARAEFKIDELFDRIIETLSKLAECGDLDSRKALNDLEGVILVLQKSRDGSFTAQYTSWKFVRRFVPNVISAYVKRSKVAGPIVEAFEQTAAELDESLEEATDRISESLLNAASTGFVSDGIKGIEKSDVTAAIGPPVKKPIN